MHASIMITINFISCMTSNYRFSIINVFLATFPTVLVATTSKVAPTIPPTKGIVLPKLTKPFCPNLVSNLNPTA